MRAGSLAAGLWRTALGLPDGAAGLTWAEAIKLARFLAVVTNRRYRVRPHPIRRLGWIAEPTSAPPRVGNRRAPARHLGVVR